MVPLEEALAPSPGSMRPIACLASLDPDTTEQVREALGHHRTDPRLPVLFLLRDPSLYASTQATSLGATDLLPYDASEAELTAAARRMGDTSACPGAAEGAGEYARGRRRRASAPRWSRLLQTAKARKPIPLKLLDQGAERLLVAMRRAGIPSLARFRASPRRPHLPALPARRRPRRRLFRAPRHRGGEPAHAGAGGAGPRHRQGGDPAPHPQQDGNPRRRGAGPDQDASRRRPFAMLAEPARPRCTRARGRAPSPRISRPARATPTVCARRRSPTSCASPRSATSTRR